jgi:hypothetical protein
MISNSLLSTNQNGDTTVATPTTMDHSPISLLVRPPHTK